MRKDERVQKERVRAEVAPTSRSVKSVFNAAHRSAAVKIAAWSLALGLASCSPATLNAQETVKPPEKGKAEVAAVEKKPVSYDVISDLSDLQQYVNNAEKNQKVVVNVGETKQVGPYTLKIDKRQSNDRYTVFEVTTNDGYYEKITATGTLQDVSIFLLDKGDNHPYIKGEMLVFVGKLCVDFIYRSKDTGKYAYAGVSLEEGNMRQVPVYIGTDDTSESFAVIIFPKDTRPGDIIAQGELAYVTNDTYKRGHVYNSFFVYEPEAARPPSIAMNK